MRTFTSIVGHVSDDPLREVIERLSIQGKVSWLCVPACKFGRKRFRAVDQNGEGFGVALPRDSQLRDGSVLYVDEECAVVVDAEPTPRLRIRALSVPGALQLGWAAGHLHWKVRLDGCDLSVLLEGPREEYLRRIEPLIRADDIEPQD